MQHFIIKERIKEEIGDREVKAAIFQTFNFDPRFFENHVMPLVVKDEQFKDEVIHNKILWRNYLKEGRIPPVTVFCDFHAKNNAEAPSLGYNIYCIRTPGAPGKICNYHPKNIFLLLEGNIPGSEEKTESLLVVTGSGNLTDSGWCSNFECFSIQEFKKDSHPRTVNQNILQKMFEHQRSLAGYKTATKAEERIENYLRYTGQDLPYFSSIEQPFRLFLEENIFSVDTITEMEIISPYFSDDTELLRCLKEDYEVPFVKCLIPITAKNEIALSFDTFDQLQQHGITWSFWEYYEKDGTKTDRNKELRNQHAKIYRFYGKARTYTIVGSVNFTNPAWKGFTWRMNGGNVEFARLYVEKGRLPDLLRPASKFNPGDYLFFNKSEPENAGTGSYEDRNVPEIEFRINWENEVLDVKILTSATGYTYHNIMPGTDAGDKGKYSYQLTRDEIKRLARHTAVEIIHQETERISTYYVHQDKIEKKPLDFRLDVTTILRYWEFLEDEYGRSALLRDLAETVTNASGFVDPGKVHNHLLMNEMATHFNGLVKLERHIFRGALSRKRDKKEQCKIMRYFLLEENIDTLKYYLDDLHQKHDNGHIFHSFYWMVLQIVCENFYKQALKSEYVTALDAPEQKDFRKGLHAAIRQLTALAASAAAKFNIQETQQKWVVDQLKKNYEFYDA